MDGTKDPDIIRFFTERRLRPLTMLSVRRAQMVQITELVAEARNGTSDLEEILDEATGGSGPISKGKR